MTTDLTPDGRYNEARQIAKPRLLIVGDFACATGFARVNQEFANQLEKDWNIYVLAINYGGDPHPLARRYPIYRAMNGGDAWGVGRLPQLVHAIKPNAIYIAQDSWNVPLYTEALKMAGLKVPVVAHIPVDAPNQHRAGGMELAHVIATTQFGLNELIAGGYKGTGSVLGYGVDTDTFKPGDRREARKRRNFPEHMLDAFVVGRADRNAMRKRYDLSTMYFAEWWADNAQPKDAFLYYHCSTIDEGWDIQQLCSYYGVGDQLILTMRGMDPGVGVSIGEVADIYRTWNVHFSTTLGEGWGLVTHESAACGIPQLLPKYSALGEWMADGATFMGIESHSAMTSGINTIGGIASKEEAKVALSYFYNNRNATVDGAAAFKVATDRKLSWPVLGAELNDILWGVKRG